MPSTYDPILRLELQAVGENINTWGIKANQVFERLAEALTGQRNIDVVGSGNYTLTIANAFQDESRFAALRFTGALTGNRDIILPSGYTKWYLLKNETTGNFRLRVKTSSGSSVILDRNVWTYVYCDGVDTHLIWPQGAGQTLQSTSTTSVAIGSGSKTLFVSPGKNFVVGQWVSVHPIEAPESGMVGQITAYNTSTGELTFNSLAQFVRGSGTFAHWNVNAYNASALIGPKFLYGNGVPAPSLGYSGDLYLDTAGGDIYAKINNTWTLQINIIGPTGAGSTVFVRDNGILVGAAKPTLNFSVQGMVIEDNILQNRYDLSLNLTGNLLSFYTRGIY